MKIRFGISCKSSARQISHMKCQALFPLENTKKMKMFAAVVLISSLSVTDLVIIVQFDCLAVGTLLPSVRTTVIIIWFTKPFPTVHKTSPSLPLPHFNDFIHSFTFQDSASRTGWTSRISSITDRLCSIMPVKHSFTTENTFSQCSPYLVCIFCPILAWTNRRIK